MKAYKVSDVGCNFADIIFADTPSDAKYLARCEDWFSGSSYINLRASRLPEADHLRTTRGVVRWTQEVMRLVRRLGWSEWAGSSDVCEECGLSVFEDLEESWLDEQGVCKECRG